MVEYIKKRDGSLERWDKQRVVKAIDKAMRISDVVPNEHIANAVFADLDDRDVIEQETLQNMIENKLMLFGYYKVAKNYIIYREKRREIRVEKSSLFDTCEAIDSYIDQKDWRINENANSKYSYQGMTLNINGKIQAMYMLNKYPPQVTQAHHDGYIHLHDLSQAMAGYCAGWSLFDLILEGFNLDGMCSSAPANHLDSLFGQVVNFIGTLQNEWAGAQGFSSFDTLCAPFVRHDGLSYEDVKQSIQRLVFNLNTTSRWGGQTPFSNLTFDLTCPKHYSTMPSLIKGLPTEDVYGDFQKEMDMINLAFLEVMNEGDSKSNIFTFPIPTYNITKDFDWSSNVSTKIFEMASKYGAPYFQNFINSDMDPSDTRSFCCRISLDMRQVKAHLEKLERKTGGLFGSGDLTGSIGVVTLNLPKMAFLSKDKREFMDNIKKYANISKVSLEFKRKMLVDNLKHGMYPWTKRYLKKGFDSHFSTIGVIGGHEACLNLIGVGIETNEGVELMQEVLNLLRDLMIEFQKETGNMYNMEATPCEGTSHKLAKLDTENHPSIITSGNGDRYYTNSTQLHVEQNDILFALENQNKLQPLYTSGTVLHAFLGESLPNVESVKTFIKDAFTNTKIPYLSVTPTFSICENCGYVMGEHFECPKCSSECNVYSRVVGYYRPVQQWNKGKKAEFKDRKMFEIAN